MSGCSGRPLAAKLGVREGARVALVGAPAGVEALLAPLPGGAAADRDDPEGADVVLAFATSAEDLRALVPALGRDVFPDRMLWIAWPKRASGVATDVTEDVVRAVALPLGLVDTKVCAIDATWSGLRLVWRRELRAGRPG